MSQTTEMDSRLHETQRKIPMLRQRDHEMSGDHRLSEARSKRTAQDEKTPFRRARSPSRPRISSSFRPRFGGRFYRPRGFLRDERVFRKPSFGLGFQRYNHFSPRPRYPWRDHPGPRSSVCSSPHSSQKNSEQRIVKSSSPATPKEHSRTPRLSTSSSREKEKPSLSFTVSQDAKRSEKDSRERGREREVLSTVSRAAARSRAIQDKRKEIEEVYRQDCDTFAVVVRMLIAKDPSLELPIQTSLQENLREIGLRCVEAMEEFIQDYDSRELSPN